jgi:hypothetical protein
VIKIHYEFADDLPPDSALAIEEDRGTVTYRINPRLTPAQMLQALNTGVEAVLSGGHWFQEWRGDIISCTDPANPGQAIPMQHPTTHDTGECGAA